MPRPKIRPWTDEELRRFQDRVRQLLDRLHWTQADLDVALGYAPQGKMTAQVLGLYGNGRHRQPSQPYVRKFERLEAAPPAPKPPWGHAVLPLRDLDRGAVPLQRVLSSPRQCPMCLVEFRQGRRTESDTWWWFGHPRQRYCSPAHKRAWRRLQRSKRRQSSQSGR